MIRISRILLAMTIAAPLIAGGAAAQDSLYKRLGGYDAIAAVTDDFLAQLITNETFARFFFGASNDTKKRIRQHIIDLMCQTTGGPCVYVGRDMKVSHEGLGINKAEWDASLAAFAYACQAEGARAGAEGACRDPRSAREGHRREALSGESPASTRIEKISIRMVG